MYCPKCGQQQSEEVHVLLTLRSVALRNWALVARSRRTDKSRRRTETGFSKKTSHRRCCKGRVLQWDPFPDWSVRWRHAERTAMVGCSLVGIPCESCLDALLPTLYERGRGLCEVDVGDRCPRPTRSIYLRLKVPGLFSEAHRVNTAEMTQPPSITEYTTNLLKKN